MSPKARTAKGLLVIRRQDCQATIRPIAFARPPRLPGCVQTRSNTVVASEVHAVICARHDSHSDVPSLADHIHVFAVPADRFSEPRIEVRRSGPAELGPGRGRVENLSRDFVFSGS